MTPRELYLKLADELDCIDKEEFADWMEKHVADAGFAIVPVEPTDEMGWAVDADDCSTPDACRSVYKAMIAATQNKDSA